jgi:hypothetical protein
MKIRALSAEGVGGNHRLRLKTVLTNWTAELDLTQSRHDTLFNNSRF